MKKEQKKNLYKDKLRNDLKELLNIENVMAVPKLEKIVINRGFGKDVVVSNNVINTTVEQFIAITGQLPILTKSKKAISNFKIRKDQVLGCKVTLRSEKMFDFLSKLMNIILPKIRDFRGVPLNSFDGQGNYTLAIKEDSIFPEIGNFDKIRGLDITFVTSSLTSDKQCYELLKLLGMPFRKQ